MSDEENKQLCFCQVVYFSSVRLQSWMEQFHSVALKYATELGRVLTHFDFWPEDTKTRCPALRYIKRNQKRLIQAFSSKTYKGIDFYSKDESFFWLPFYLSLVTKDSFLLKNMGGYGIVLIRCLLSSLKEHISEFSISKRFLCDIKSIVNPAYGAVIVMQQGKEPSSYFRSPVGPSALTDEERQEMRIWEREGHRFETIVRDIYWGNILNRNHWGNDKTREKYLLNAIEHECRENVFWIDEKTLFFCAPFDICTQDDPKMIDFKERMYKVFDKLEIEVIRAHLDRYPEPQIEPQINLIEEGISKKPKKLRSKKKLIIRYHIKKDSQETREQECISDILQQVGPLPLIIKSEKVQDGLLGEITVDGSKVPKVRKAIIYCIKKMGMDIEVNPPIDEENSIDDVDFTVL